MSNLPLLSVRWSPGARSAARRVHALLFLTAGLTAGSAQPYTFITLAGDPAGSSADGTGRAAGFHGPSGVAVDGSGNVFVADTFNHTIRKITPAGIVTTVAGSPGQYGNADGTGSAARFAYPHGVAVDRSGNVFVADTQNHTIRKITASGVVTTLAGSNNGRTDGTGSAARFSSPSGVAVDGSGNVFVADTNNATIRKITAGGIVTTLAGSGIHGSADGTGSAARFSYIKSVAVDGSGNVFVADSDNRTIRKITADGVVTTLAGTARSTGGADGTGSAARFFYPQSVAVDGTGNVFVADATDPHFDFDNSSGLNGTIRKITPAGVVTTLAGSADSSGSADGTGSAARFFYPQGVAVDGGGNVFVGDSGNGTIRQISAAGVVTTLAGGGSLDGVGSAARFHTPTGVAVDGSGNVFVADSGNHTIRKIAAGGVVTTLAGLAGSSGSANGTGSAARFSYPTGVAVDGSGNVFVADSRNGTVRKITAAGVVTTLAGSAGALGTADGTGSAAQFGDALFGVAVDQGGNVFVADGYGYRGTIRKITASGGVTTLADAFYGPTGVAVDGSGNVFVTDVFVTHEYPPFDSVYPNTIRKITADGLVTKLADEFYAPFGIGVGVAVDRGGNVFVVEPGSGTIKNITATGVVMTLGGVWGSRGSADGTGSAARFNFPSGIAVDGSGNVFVADTGNNTIRKGVPGVSAPLAVTAPQSQHINPGANATFTVGADDSGRGFQWKKDGVPIVGARGATYQLSGAAAADMGFYSVVVGGAAGTIESPVAILTVATGGTSRLSNFSARGLVPAGGDLTVGFAVRGGGGKSVLVRAVGPTLGNFGVPGALADPRLDVFPAGTSIATGSNDDWSAGAVLANEFASVGAFALASASKDAAVLSTLAIGAYSARVTSSLAGGSGIVLTEVYDRDPAAAAGQLINISALSSVGASAPAFTLGFVIDGAAPKQLLIRAVGPGLTPLGVTGVLGTPQLSVIPLGKTFAVASNDTWGGDAALASAFVLAGAFALPVSSKDAAIVVRLPPGGYTVTVSGVAETTGRALVEIYDLDP